MTSIQRRYSKEELAKRGEAVYDKEIRPHLKSGDEGKCISVDIETGEYELGADELEACDRLQARVPGAQIWLKKVGSPYLHRFGGREWKAGP